MIMTNNAKLPKIELVKVELLRSKEPYQRKVKSKNVQKIFDPNQYTSIIVSHRDGNYNIVDGQHRHLIYKNTYGLKGELRCEVRYGLSYQEEAALFKSLNSQSKSLTPLEEFNADIESGDELSLNIKNCVESVGFYISLSGGAGDNKISAIRKVENIYKDIGHLGLSEILKIIKQVWNGDNRSLQQEVFSAFRKFYKTYKGQYAEETLVKALEKEKPSVFMRESQELDVGESKYARTLVRLYNKKVRATKNKLDESALNQL